MPLYLGSTHNSSGGPAARFEKREMCEDTSRSGRAASPPAPPFMSGCQSLPLDVGEFLRYLAVSHAKHIHATYMPATPVGICPIVLPASDAAIFMCDHLLGLENGIRRGTKKLFPKVANRFLSFKPCTIWRRIGVFKDAVLGHQGHHRLNVVPVEGVVKLVDYLNS